MRERMGSGDWDIPQAEDGMWRADVTSLVVHAEERWEIWNSKLAAVWLAESLGVLIRGGDPSTVAKPGTALTTKRGKATCEVCGEGKPAVCRACYDGRGR